MRIISEASLATALNEEEEELEEEIQPVRVTTKRSESHNVQPKVESLEFLDDIQPTQQPSNKQPQNITYMNMDSFTEKTNTVTNQQQQQSAVTRKIVHMDNKKKINFLLSEYVQAGTSQQQPAVEYKSGEWNQPSSIPSLT